MKWRPWAAVLLVVLTIGCIRWRLLGTPLERDEGEYAYAGQLMLAGVPPYQLAANMKLPGTYASFAVIMGLLGETARAIHTGLLLVNAGAIVLMFLLGRRLFGASAGIAAAAAYALMSAGAGVMGTQAHATHFVVLAALGGALLLARYAETPSLPTLWAGGLLLGLAFVMKQHGMFFDLFGVVYLAAIEWKRRRGLPLRLVWFLPALAAPFAVTCLILWLAGVFPKFWFWTFHYASAYAAERSFPDGLAAFGETFPPIFLENAGIWILAAAGLVLVWRKRSGALFPTALLLFSFLAVCPGLYFREHYFVMMLPAVALLAGSVVRSRTTWCLFTAALAFSVFTQREYLFHMTPLRICRQLYGLDPFPEAERVAGYIRAHSTPSSRVAVIGSEPEIYFYSGRRSAVSSLYLYPLLEAQPYALRMQQEMIDEVQAGAPEYVVRYPVENLLLAPGAPSRIFDWWSVYGPEHYRVVGIADILSEEHTEYRWDAAAASYEPQSKYYLVLYRRKDAAPGGAVVAMAR